MRFIIQSDVQEHLPDDWDEIVSTALTYVEKKVEAARAKATANGKRGHELEADCLAALHDAINAKASVWRKAADALSKASHGKCWYCESKPERSDMPVDHFRPKNSVVEDATHPGYTWLAFEWKNFRLSCTFCNSKRRDLETGTTGGKQDHFPILRPPDHSRQKNDPLDRPKLLDPVDDEDTKLITFLANGFPHPANDDPVTVDRVEASIDLYHLKQAALVRKRKMLAVEIEEHVSQAEKAIAMGDNENRRYHRTQIIMKARAKAPFSAAAKVYLGAYRDRPWVAQLLERDL
jgi:uncharacterized protein (TIGR02646 family)